jgi:hypothetical protein
VTKLDGVSGEISGSGERGCCLCGRDQHPALEQVIAVNAPHRRRRAMHRTRALRRKTLEAKREIWLADKLVRIWLLWNRLAVGTQICPCKVHIAPAISNHGVALSH